MNETVVFRNELGGYSTPYDKDTLARLYYELQKENEQLRARLENAVELPCVKLVKTKEWINREKLGEILYEWTVIYIDKEGYFVVEPCASKYAAESRLAELKGGRE